MIKDPKIFQNKTSFRLHAVCIRVWKKISWLSLNEEGKWKISTRYKMTHSQVLVRGPRVGNPWPREHAHCFISVLRKYGLNKDTAAPRDHEPPTSLCDPRSSGGTLIGSPPPCSPVVSSSAAGSSEDWEGFFFFFTFPDSELFKLLFVWFSFYKWSVAFVLAL